MKSFAKRLGTRIACGGTISENGELLLDEPLPRNQPGRVQIVILFPVVAAVDRLGLAILNIEAASTVDELRAYVDRHLSIQIDRNWLYVI